MIESLFDMERVLIIIIATFLACSHLAVSQSCDKLYKREIDKFKDEVMYYSAPLKEVAFMKIIESGEEKSFISLKAPGSTINVGIKGAYILLGDGSKIIWEDADIESDVASNGRYSYNAFHEISDEEISRIANQGIVAYKLYIYELELSSKKVDLLKKQATCLSELK